MAVLTIFSISRQLVKWKLDIAVHSLLWLPILNVTVTNYTTGIFVAFLKF